MRILARMRTTGRKVDKFIACWIHTHHRGLARFWLLFGAGGVANAIFRPGGIDITQSIPVLFFISVYANAAGHFAALEANPDEDFADGGKE